MRYYEIHIGSRVLGYVNALSTIGAIRTWQRLHPGCSDAICAYELC
jgi:hypothetical protein